MSKLRRILISTWNWRDFYIVPVVRIKTGYGRPPSRCIMFHFLGWNLFYTKYREYSVEDLKESVKQIRK